MTEPTGKSLLPCPICGGEADGTYPVSDTESWVACSNCEPMGRQPIPLAAWQSLPRVSDAVREVAREMRELERGIVGEIGYGVWYTMKLRKLAARLETAGQGGESWCESCGREITMDGAYQVCVECSRPAVPAEVSVIIWDKPGWHDVECYSDEQAAYDRANNGDKTGHVQIRRVPVHGVPEPRETDPYKDEWICSDCGARLSDGMDAAWRWNGDIMEHKCPGYSPQCGYSPARRFAGTEPRDTCGECRTDPCGCGDYEPCDECEMPEQWERLHERIAELEDAYTTADADAEGWATMADALAAERDAARAEVEQLRAGILRAEKLIPGCDPGSIKTKAELRELADGEGLEGDEE